MSKYRTAQGRMIDMAALAAANEKTRAVGNMPVNARGDTIDADGNTVVPVTKKVGEKYQKSVMNKQANIIKNKNANRYQPQRPAAPTPPPAEELTAEEVELEASLEEELEIENIKAQSESGFAIKPASEAPDFYKPE